MPNVSPLKLYTQEQRREGMRSLIMLHLKKHGGRATSRTVAGSIGKALKFVWPRFTELAEQGRIRDTGERVTGLRGRPQVIWADVETTDPKTTSDDEYAGYVQDCMAGHAKIYEEPNWFKNFGQ